jgi:WD40 repeat protein
MERSHDDEQDLRDREPVNRKNFKHACAITALTFSPDDPHAIVIATERGTIKRYDLRNAARSMGAVFGAHGLKPVLDLKWKLGENEEGIGSTGWLASAGADRTVQVSSTPDAVATVADI